MIIDAQCPRCRSSVVCRQNNEQQKGSYKYLCLACSKEFIWDPHSPQALEQVACFRCGAPMELYMLESDAVRFKCEHHHGSPTIERIKKGGRLNLKKAA